MHILLVPFSSHLSAILEKPEARFPNPPKSPPGPLSPEWSMSRAETHLSVVPRARADPVLVSLVDEAIIIHDTLLSLGLTVQIDSVS